MTQDILAYINGNDPSLADFSHRFQILAGEGLVCADDIHHAIELISLRHEAQHKLVAAIRGNVN